MMGLPWCVVVESLKVHHSTWLSIIFGCDYHPAAPSYRFIDGYRFYHTKFDITVQTFFHCISPVQWDLGRSMDCNSLSLRVNMEF